MKIVWAALLVACGAEVALSWLPRRRILQFAIGPLTLLAVVGLVSPGTIPGFPS